MPFTPAHVAAVPLDLALGLLCVALWRVVAAPVVRDLSRGRVRGTIPVRAPASSAVG